MKDRMGRWFKVISALGRNETNLFRRALWNPHTRTLEQQEVRDYPHSLMDGLGAMVTFLRELGGHAEYPTLGRKQAPSILKRPGILLRSQRLMGQAGARWAHRAWNGKQPDQEEFHVLVFSEVESAQLQKHCGDRGISLIAFLVTQLQDAAAALLAEPTSRQGWFIPVNMRGGVQMPNLAMNHSSAVPLFVARGARAEDVHTQLKQRLKAQVHWGNWWAYSLGALLSERWMTRLYKRYSATTFWMGTVSDMGSWNTGPEYRTLGENEVWFAAPPGCQNYPITCLPLTFNGRTTITMKVHPSISGSAEPSRELAVRLEEQIRQSLT